MGRPNKPMARDTNSRFTTRNNKQDIFSKIAKSSREKTEFKKQSAEVNQPEEDKTSLR